MYQHLKSQTNLKLIYLEASQQEAFQKSGLAMGPFPYSIDLYTPHPGGRRANIPPAPLCCMFARNPCHSRRA